MEEILEKIPKEDIEKSFEEMTKKASTEEHMETNFIQVQAEMTKVINMDQEWKQLQKSPSTINRDKS